MLSFEGFYFSTCYQSKRNPNPKIHHLILLLLLSSKSSISPLSWSRRPSPPLKLQPPTSPSRRHSSSFPSSSHEVAGPVDQAATLLYYLCICEALQQEKKLISLLWWDLIYLLLQKSDFYIWSGYSDALQHFFRRSDLFTAQKNQIFTSDLNNFS